MKRTDYGFAHSAQGVMKNAEAPAACGSACGSGDKPKEEKPAACGSACGAGDSSAQGDACNKQETAEEKPAACGSACGAGEK